MIIRRHAGIFETSHLSREREDQVWSSDITFIPVGRGYLYLVAIMDWAARTVLSWRVANTMHGDFCVDALNEAIGKYGPRKTMNTDTH
ncbi:MAG: DDE-type integrase/transposase/recombinase [Alphaproteobacteria bacterium]|jgi:putative transposase|nr:DDE-type integrase/transposase/recombinase [Alphaproteobacteria bacterium]